MKRYEGDEVTKALLLVDSLEGELTVTKIEDELNRRFVAEISRASAEWESLQDFDEWMTFQDKIRLAAYKILGDKLERDLEKIKQRLRNEDKR